MNNPSVKPIKTLPWEYDERRFELEANSNVRPAESSVAVAELIKPVIGGLTELNFGAALDTAADAGLDLLNRIAGTGEQKSDVVSQAEKAAQDAQENPSSAGSANTIAPDHETSPKTVQALQDFFRRMSAEKSLVQSKQEAAESLRILDGEIATDEEARNEGYRNAKSIHALFGMAAKRAEVQKEIEGQQQAESIAATNPKRLFSIGENELSMREGNSKFGGVGDTGGPG